jgi:hypothetical protein
MSIAAGSAGGGWRFHDGVREANAAKVAEQGAHRDSVAINANNDGRYIFNWNRPGVPHSFRSPFFDRGALSGFRNQVNSFVRLGLEDRGFAAVNCHDLRSTPALDLSHGKATIIRVSRRLQNFTDWFR